MTAKKISVGVVGAGYIATFAHLPPLSQLPEASLDAICDQNVEKARNAARRFNVPKVYCSLDEMLRGEKLDLIDICLPPQEHKHTLLKVLERGINCLVEKPLAVTTAEADAIISVAQKNKASVHVTHNYSVVPAIVQAKKIVGAGKIGQVLGVNIEQFVLPHERYFEPDHWCHSLPGEYFGDIAPHLAMLLVEFMGPVTEVVTRSAKLSNFPLRFDELRLIARTTRALGTITCSLNCPSFLFVMDIFGERGAIHLSGDYQALVYYPPMDHYVSAFTRGMNGIKDITSRVEALARTSLGVLTGRYSTLTYGHRHLIQRCLRTLQGKDTYPLDTYNAREAVYLLELAFKQMKEQ
jgi:predicted dehydrogenase